MKNVLIVDDLVAEFDYYAKMLRALDLTAFSAGTVEKAKDVLASHPIDLVLVDMHLTAAQCEEGLIVLREICEHYPYIVTIAMSSDPRIDLHKKARALGASQFIKKPILQVDELSIIIQQAREHKQLARMNPRQPLPGSRASILDRFPQGIVVSEDQQKLIRAVASHARRIPVLLKGETGTGKEEIARLIHLEREKQEGPIPFVTVNCANITGDLVASMLFGHKKGAFTGATHASQGAIGEADGGILFLDEIQSLPLDSQRRLLRSMNDGSYTRLGENTELRSNFQVIVASTKDLDDEVENGTFLIDLRMRLMGVELELKPLRNRKEDLQSLILVFLAKENVRLSESTLAALVERCSRYYWQGNIRQLFKVLQTWLLMSSLNGEEPSASNLPEYRTMLAPGEHKASRKVHPRMAKAFELLHRASHEDVPLESTIDEVERAIIASSLERHKLVQDSYKGLEISRTTLDYKRRKHKL